MWESFKHWRAQRFCARHPFPEAAWHQACQRYPLLAQLPEPQQSRLGHRAWQFLHDKHLSLHANLAPAALDDAQRLAIAAQACLLSLGWSDSEHHDALANVHEILILPDVIRREVEEIDDAGVVHQFVDQRAGETFHQGPVVLALPDVIASGRLDGFNVVIHEFAHKLDMGNSMDADGFPPLPADISPQDWYREFMTTWDDLHARLDNGQPTPIDDYAASHPGECFAVCCEHFFTTPLQLREAYPGLYSLLCRYFHQTPHDWHQHPEGWGSSTT
ncbi:zinc-dependent peptidase [Halomonas huangheensis]|uniref:Protein MtfA n=1 Tax=Halomonas huangheensis TaxID=1178482 RepID=W1N3F7_9GAMM|nr:M90 family metallopeptidase [Halomonas huangheensis]ALM51548.1 hypothetical protein AR456_04005 [Halomonas huangheensis]ERL50019.1 hypothetical protein BJB45_02510 [Halomonas huangheensis]